MWQSQNQHDIAEFMQYLMRKARPDSMRGLMAKDDGGWGGSGCW